MNEFDKIDDLMDQGEYNKTLSIIDSYQNQESSYPKRQILEIKKCYIYNCLGQYERAIEISNDFLRQSNTKENQLGLVLVKEEEK